MIDRSTCVGVVASLSRYPVKSMQGEELDAAAITQRGILGDRAYAVVERATGHVASAKHPRKRRSGITARRYTFLKAALHCGAP